MTGQLVRWATPFEAERGRTSVATASCCCCCCCCLASSAGLVGYAGRAPLDEARRNARGIALPLVLGVAAAPLGVLVYWLSADTFRWRWLILALVVGLVLFEFAGLAAGAKPSLFALRGIAALGFWLFASAIELQAVVFLGVMAGIVVRWEILLAAWVVAALGAAVIVVRSMGAVAVDEVPGEAS